MFNKPTESSRKRRASCGRFERLYDSKNYFVAGLVLLFSVIVPFIKMALLGVIFWAKNPATKYRLYLFVRSVSKWAMADVFAVGVFIAFMAGNAIDNLDAKLHPGFYYFIAYCLISNLSFQFLHVAAARAGDGDFVTVVLDRYLGW